MQPDNKVVINVKMFDMAHKVEADIGRYENAILAQDVKVEHLMKDIKKAFNEAYKKIEIDLNNMKKGI